MGYNVDAAINSSLYGADCTPQAVLGGKHNPPAGIEELYDALNKVC